MVDDKRCSNSQSKKVYIGEIHIDFYFLKTPENVIEQNFMEEKN